MLQIDVMALGARRVNIQFIIILLTESFLETLFGKTQSELKQLPRHPNSYRFRDGPFQEVLPPKNISKLLDNLFRGYDPKLRPSWGGLPTIVEIDVEVCSMGQISEMDMTFSMDCYFRQSWIDERLSFSETEEAFTLSLAVLERLWKPDTFIYNGKQSYTHLITTPNKFVRLHNSGKVLYSSRLTIQAICPMDLEDFPMDTQKCPLQLGSFGYTTQDVIYQWNKQRQLVIATDMKLSQFDLIATPSAFGNITRRAAEHSTLMASFYLQRHMGNFLIQVYGPCMLLVVLSWVSFWLNREATADRISLGVTTVLTMTFLGLEARTDLPKVAYSTALDLFVWISYGFIFATIIEFAFVHYFTKFGSGEISVCEADEDDTETPMEEMQAACTSPTRGLPPESCPICSGVGSSIQPIPQYYPEHFHDDYLTEDTVVSSSLPGHLESHLNVTPPLGYPRILSAITDGQQMMDLTRFDEQRCEVLPIAGSSSVYTIQDQGEVLSNSGSSSSYGIETLRGPGEICAFCHGRIHDSVYDERIFKGSRKKRTSLKPSFCSKVLGIGPRSKLSFGKANKRVKIARVEESMRKMPKDQMMNSVSRIDVTARILFPLLFLLVNLIYWYVYLSHSQRLKHLTPPQYAHATPPH